MGAAEPASGFVTPLFTPGEQPAFMVEFLCAKVLVPKSRVGCIDIIVVWQSGASSVG